MHHTLLTINFVLLTALAGTAGAGRAAAQGAAEGAPPRAAQQAAQPVAGTPVPPRPGAMGIREAVILAEGWAMLAQGRFPQAVAHAGQVLALSPRSVPALTLLVEAELARAGAAAGLDQYENWLGARAFEEPSVLRRVAIVLLEEEAAQRQDAIARAEALRALADAGDAEAIQELAAAVSKGVSVEVRALAAMGDVAAVSALIAHFDEPGGDNVLVIDALGESRNPSAIPVLLSSLDDQRVEIRGAAAQALGLIGDTEVAAKLRPLLNDRSGYVRVKAAGALYRLNDHAGLQVLQDTLTDPDPRLRLAAAEAMAGMPNRLWTATVQELTGSDDPEVRVWAARLLAVEDPVTSRRILAESATDANPAIREMAARAAAETVTDDFSTLRRMMRHEHRLTRVRAAARVVALTQ